jgi:SAM-dependent methyltransferase
VEAKNYSKIVQHYEMCLEKFGDTHKGVDWPNQEDAFKRYKVMLQVCEYDLKKQNRATLLDFGCGTAHMYEYMQANKISDIEYSGLDISEKFVGISKMKFPHITFYQADILEQNNLPMHDYIVMNGVFTEKRELTFDAMFLYFKDMIKAVYAKANRGVAFNVMSKHVDWERDDLFHLPFDTLAAFLTKEVTRNFIIRNDYGLYEYTMYLYK